MSEIKNTVLELLSGYHSRQTQIALLRYELEHPAHISDADMIDALSFRHNSESSAPSGYVSNKTLYIALNYREKASASNEATINEIAVQLYDLEQQARLLHYISLLDERESKIISMTYIDRMKSEGIAEKLGISVRTLRTLRNEAIDSLCEMYQFTKDLS